MCRLLRRGLSEGALPVAAERGGGFSLLAQAAAGEPQAAE